MITNQLQLSSNVQKALVYQKLISNTLRQIQVNTLFIMYGSKVKGALNQL